MVGYSHPKSKYTQTLAEFLDITGVWEKGAMKFVPNVLPLLQKRILAAAKQFFVIVKASPNTGSPFIDTFYAPIQDDFDDEVDEPEEVEEEQDDFSEGADFDEEEEIPFEEATEEDESLEDEFFE